MKFSVVLALLTFVCPLAPAQQPVTQPAHGQIQGRAAASNEELKAMVVRDQAVRTPTSTKESVSETDAGRRVIVHRMLEKDQLRTGLDYRNAALILQHSLGSDDYLLAHLLAVLGAAKGDKVALWLAAATLDRYLQSIRQPQIYGTQTTRPSRTAPWTLNPYNRTLLTDTLRQQTGVPLLAEQIADEHAMNKQPPPQPSESVK